MGIVENQNTPRNVVSVDLGASSGRIMLVRMVFGQPLSVTEAHRFSNGAVRQHGSLRWDIEAIFSEILHGIGAAARLCAQAGERLDSIGIDSWAVDYGLLDESGELVGLPHHYRDSRTQGMPKRVYEVVSASEHYAVNGMQTQPFNTEFQLIAESASGGLESAKVLLLIPDLLGYWLTGRAVTEVTNASTSGMVDAERRTWALGLISRVEREVLGAGLQHLLTDLVEAGTTVGELLPSVAHAIGVDYPVRVIAVGSHDTASAVVAVPADPETHFAYISCGTWSLVGLELEAPVLSEESRQANFANELGVDGTVRYLKNVMGLWVFQECVRAWRELGEESRVSVLVELASRAERGRTIIDINAPDFFPPAEAADGWMMARIHRAAKTANQPVPQTQAEIVRCIIDSLASAYRDAIHEAEALSGQRVEIVHMVGGGIQNRLLCQATADVTGLRVLAGPVEGAIVGNALVQWRALERGSVGADDGDSEAEQSSELHTLSDLRAASRVGLDLKVYEPVGRASTVDLAMR